MAGFLSFETRPSLAGRGRRRVAPRDSHSHAHTHLGVPPAATKALNRCCARCALFSRAARCGVHSCVRQRSLGPSGVAAQQQKTNVQAGPLPLTKRTSTLVASRDSSTPVSGATGRLATVDAAGDDDDASSPPCAKPAGARVARPCRSAAHCLPSSGARRRADSIAAAASWPGGGVVSL